MDRFNQKATQLYEQHRQFSELVLAKGEMLSEARAERSRRQSWADKFNYGRGYTNFDRMDADRALREAQFQFDGAKDGLELAQRAVDINLAKAAVHYATNSDAYHAQAIQEAQADGVPIDFREDVAANVVIHGAA